MLLACSSDTGRRLRQLIHFVTVNTEVWNCPQMDPEKGMGSGNCMHKRAPLLRRRLHPAPTTISLTLWPAGVWNPKTNRSLASEFLEWLEADLEAANKPAARAAHPWIVMYAHKAFCKPPLHFARFGKRKRCG